MQGDVSFSGTEIALIGALLGAVIGALGVVFQTWQRAVNAHIDELHERIRALEEDRDWWREQATRLLHLSQESLKGM